jgi:Ribonuclease H2 non-catalytic subunit (Ylr154p-like)
MAPVIIEIAPVWDSSDLPACTPNLMPFHIDHSGPASISTYFRVKPSSSHVGAPAADSDQSAVADGDDVKAVASSVAAMDSEESRGSGVNEDSSMSRPETKSAPQSSGTSATQLWKHVSSRAARFVAAFRGRTVHGLQVDVPAGYVGLVLRVENEAKGQADSANVMAEKSRASTATPKRKTKAGGRVTRNSSQIIDVDGEDDTGSVAPAGSDAGVDAQEENMTRRTLKPTDKFSSFVLWHPDNPVDEGQDEYFRSLTEWTRLASLVRRRRFTSTRYLHMVAQIHQFEE